MGGKTIAQIAEEIGVSKQAIQKRIKKEPLKTLLELYITTKGVTIYIDEDGVNLIKSEYGITATDTDNDNEEPTEIIIELPTTTESEKIEVAENRQAVEIEKNIDSKGLTQNAKHIVKAIGTINVVVLSIVCYWFGFSVAVIATVALITAVSWILCNCLISITILGFKNKDI